MGVEDGTPVDACEGQGVPPRADALPVCQLSVRTDVVWRRVGGVWVLMPRSIVNGAYMEK